MSNSAYIFGIFLLLIPAPANAQETADSSGTDSSGMQDETLDTQNIVQPAPVLPDTIKKLQPSALPEKPAQPSESCKTVDIGYGIFRKSNLLTTSIAFQDTEENSSTAAFTSEQMMQRSLGAMVTQNLAQPYITAVVQPNGIGSIYGGAPLYIIDGIPMYDIAFLHADDIASISFLNDGQSAAIYGSQGINGAILISTKKPEEGKISVSYDGFVGIQNPWRKPRMCTAEEWARLNDRAHANDSLPFDSVNYPGIQNPSSLGAGTNWFDQIINKNALMTSNSVSFGVATKNIQAYVSSNYSYIQGLIKESSYEKYGIRADILGNVRNWLSIGNNFNAGEIRFKPASEPDEWNGIMESALAIEPVIPAHDANGNLISSVNQQLNPLGIIDRTHDSNVADEFEDNLFADITFFNALKYHASLGFFRMDFENKTLYPAYAYEPYNANGFSEQNPNNLLLRTSNQALNLAFEQFLSFEKTFAGLHTVSLLLGQTAEADSFTHIAGSNMDYSNNDPSQWYLNSGSSASYARGYPSYNSPNSYFARITYDFDEKYLVSLSNGLERTFSKIYFFKWMTSPSVSAAWRASEEPFLKPVSFLSELKFFGGWSRISNQGITDSASLLFPLVIQQNSSPIYDVFGNSTYSSGATFQSYFWEDRTFANAGLDFALFKDKVGFTARYYDQTTHNHTTNMSPVYSGTLYLPQNNGITYTDKGYEINVSFKDRIRDFAANARLDLLINKNRIDSLGRPVMNGPIRGLSYVTRTETGHSIGEFYGYKTDGLFQNQAEIDADTYTDATGTHLVQPDARPGDVRYKHDADGSLTRGYIGNPHPDFTYGFTLDVGYKAFDVNVYLQGSVGNKIFNAARLTTESNAAFFNVDQYMLDSWNGPGSTNDPSLSRMTINNSGDNMLISDRYVEDGSYMRIKSLQLGYTLPRDIGLKLKLQKCRVYVGCENILTITKYRGLDPELLPNRLGILGLGVDYGSTYPQPLTFIFGITLSL